MSNWVTGIWLYCLTISKRLKRERSWAECHSDLILVLSALNSANIPGSPVSLLPILLSWLLSTAAVSIIDVPWEARKNCFQTCFRWIHRHLGACPHSTRLTPGGPKKQYYPSHAPVAYANVQKLWEPNAFWITRMNRVQRPDCMKFVPWTSFQPPWRVVCSALGIHGRNLIMGELAEPQSFENALRWILRWVFVPGRFLQGGRHRKKVAALDKVMYNDSLHVFESFRLIAFPGQWLDFSTVLRAEFGVTPRLQGGFARLCTCFSFLRRGPFSDMSFRVPLSQAFTRCDWNLGSVLEDVDRGWWMSIYSVKQWEVNFVSWCFMHVSHFFSKTIMNNTPTHHPKSHLVEAKSALRMSFGSRGAFEACQDLRWSRAARQKSLIFIMAIWEPNFKC